MINFVLIPSQDLLSCRSTSIIFFFVSENYGFLSVKVKPNCNTVCLFLGLSLTALGFLFQLAHQLIALAVQNKPHLPVRGTCFFCNKLRRSSSFLRWSLNETWPASLVHYGKRLAHMCQSVNERVKKCSPLHGRSRLWEQDSCGMRNSWPFFLLEESRFHPFRMKQTLCNWLTLT